MFRASLCPSSGDRLYRTASGVSLDVLAAVVWSQDTSWAHCVNAGIFSCLLSESWWFRLGSSGGFWCRSWWICGFCSYRQSAIWHITFRVQLVFLFAENLYQFVALYCLFVGCITDVSDWLNSPSSGNWYWFLVNTVSWVYSRIFAATLATVYCIFFMDSLQTPGVEWRRVVACLLCKRERSWVPGETVYELSFSTLQNLPWYQWRTQEFCSRGGGVQQIQLRTEDRENGDLGAVAR